MGPVTDIFIIATAAGIALGGILSYIFGAAALPTKIPYQFTIGGLPVNVILVNVIVAFLVGAVLFLGYIATIVRDAAFPIKHPGLFAIETAVVAFVPASVIYIMYDVRTKGKFNFSNINSNFLLLAAKFGVFHLLFQFSGIYSYFFG